MGRDPHGASEATSCNLSKRLAAYTAGWGHLVMIKTIHAHEKCDKLPVLGIQNTHRFQLLETSFFNCLKHLGFKKVIIINDVKHA